MMKKILFILLICLFMIPGVNADASFTDYQLSEQDFIPLNLINTTDSEYQSYIDSFNPSLKELYLYSDFNSFYNDSKNKFIFDTLYSDISGFKTFTSSNVSPNYRISVVILSSSSSSFRLHSVIIAIDLTYPNQNTHYRFSNAYVLGQYYDTFTTISEYTGNGNFRYEPTYPYFNTKFFSFSPFHDVYTSDTESYKVYYPLFLFETNYPYTITDTLDTYSIYNKNGELKYTYSAGDERPIFFPDGFTATSPGTYVNLDNYHYVILTLKDYNKKEAFETNLKVKGSIGITPVYEFGTVEKEVITDICNIGYQDFTNYRFFILKNDIINNAVYIVKACENDSQFHFDPSVFDITYVTDENVDDPVITFGGVNYHTIPFDELSNTVNDNTENGFIPGESDSSSTDVLDNVTSYVSSFWNSLSTFMSLVTKFFNTLPIEIRAISITMFTTACTLGLIKILKA